MIPLCTPAHEIPDTPSGFALSTNISQKLSILREADQKALERRGSVSKITTRILQKVPIADKDGFDIEYWFINDISGYDISFFKAIESNYLKYYQMFKELRRIESMLFEAGSICTENLDLPISGLRDQEVERRRLAEIESQRRKEEADRTAALDRREKFKGKVFTVLQKEGIVWMDEQKRHFEGLDILSAVERSLEDYHRANRLIDHEIARRGVPSRS